MVAIAKTGALKQFQKGSFLEVKKASNKSKKFEPQQQ